MKIQKEQLKNILKHVVIIIFIAIVCSSNILVNTIGNYDELWNYNFARNISDGLIPYKDFNIIQAPLIPMICSIFLKIFCNELIIMRILAVIMMTLIFFFLYKITKKVTNTEIANLILVIVLILFRDILCIDYNYAVLLIAMIMLYIELTKENKQKEKLFKYEFKYNFILGIMAGLAVLCKQTTGIAIMFASAGYKIFEIRKKEDIKTFIKIAFTRLLGSFIPILIFVIYLITNNAFKDFIDYAILGISTFSNKIEYKTLFENKETALLAAVVPISIIIMFVLMFFKKTNKKVNIFFAYSISSFIVAFPISDKIHFLTGSLITIIAIIYLIYEYIIKKIDKSKKIILVGIISFVEIVLLLSIFIDESVRLYENYIKVEKEDELNHFAYIPKDEGLNERIIEIDNYIIDIEEQGKKVYIIDAEAALYNIPLSKYNKDYDLFCKGNLGSKGEQGIIERIKDEDDAIYLIKKDNLNWQNPNKVREYIINNLKYKGEISIFYIYEKK